MEVALDTNGLSAIADGAAELRAVITASTQLAIPVIVLGEYRYGIAQSRDRKTYEEWLGQLIAFSRVIAVDAGTAEVYAAVRSELRLKGRPIPGNDIWIAALAKQHDLPLLSRDRHFDFVSGLKRIGW